MSISIDRPWSRSSHVQWANHATATHLRQESRLKRPSSAGEHVLARTMPPTAWSLQTASWYVRPGAKSPLRSPTSRPWLARSCYAPTRMHESFSPGVARSRCDGCSLEPPVTTSASNVTALKKHLVDDLPRRLAPCETARQRFKSNGDSHRPATCGHSRRQNRDIRNDWSRSAEQPPNAMRCSQRGLRPPGAYFVRNQSNSVCGK